MTKIKSYQIKGCTDDLTGRKFGHLFVFRCEEGFRGLTKCYCKCDCGDEIMLYASDLVSGRRVSCGCAGAALENKHKVMHGMHRTRLYHVWRAMNRRCRDPKVDSFKNYGARGIYVCDEWHEFIPFYEWATSHGYDKDAPRGECTLDRIDNDGPYCPSNCRWVPMSVQNKNKRASKKSIA